MKDSYLVTANNIEAPTILVVDDNTDLRVAIRDRLEVEGFRVVEASHGKAALDLLAKDPLPGLIILDIAMPHMSGREVLFVIAQSRRLSGIPVIVLSGEQPSSSEVRPGGVLREFLKKPVDPHVLISAVRRFMSVPHDKQGAG